MKKSADITLEQKLRLALKDNHLPIFKVEMAQKPAAVLIPFVQVDGLWYLLFTKRTNGVAKHQGEISFPGGAMEDCDRDLIETAVRETCEEIGIPMSHIKILGFLNPVATVTNFCVLPVVSIVDWPLPLKLNHEEVENILLIPVNWLKEPDNWYEEDLEYEPGRVKPVVHYKDFQGEHLWGFTASLAQMVIGQI